MLAGVIVSRLRRTRTSDPASALRDTFADHSLLRGASTPPESPVAESIPTPDGPPDPDDASKPESPTDLSNPSILYVLRKTAREFNTDQCTDLAAALTYYAVLSLFPALVVVVSLLGVFGQGQRTTDAVLEIVGELGPASAVDTLRTPIQQLVESPSAGFALIVGILWCGVVGVGICGRVQPGNEPNLRGRGRSTGVEIAADPAPAYPG
ncbi:MAG: rane protein, partial [Mycobacterium sp.]|nr:rane protein [Mycobacterium sp.]